MILFDKIHVGGCLITGNLLHKNFIFTYILSLYNNIKEVIILALIGFVPSTSTTYEVFGDFASDNLVEGKIYYDKSDGRLYFYSTKETRSNPNTGYFPVWDGDKTYISNFSNKKYFDKDVLKFDIKALSASINKKIAEDIRYRQRRSDNDEILNPQISDEDNMFTQCVKGVIKVKQVTIVDLVDMTSPPLSQKVVENYYSALTKITFMRIDKWNVWINIILHVNYKVEVFKGSKQLLSYKYPENIFDTGIVKYDNISKSDDDPFKKIIKILMIMENINKNSLRSDEVDDYKINNMMTTINGSKPLSAQLFSRFISMAKLNYAVTIYDNKDKIFEYKE